MTNREPQLPAVRRRFPIVGIGASAGGFEALRRLLEAMPMPHEAGVALVIIQHLAPDKPSIAPELLARYTTMEVHQVNDEPTVQAGHVYVVPPGKFLSIINGQLQHSQMEGVATRPDCYRLLLSCTRQGPT